MKLQGTNRRQPKILQKFKWSYPKRLSLSAQGKFVLLLFLIFISSAYTFQEDNSKIIDKERIINKFRPKADPDTRALEWYFYIYNIGNLNPSLISQQIEIAKSLWSDDYRNKKAILLLTQGEINKINGKHQEASAAALEAIKLLDANHSKTIDEKKLSTLAYVTFARYSKYTREKEGINFAYKALELAEDNDFATGKVLSRNQIGLLIGYFNGDYQLALEHFNKAKDLLPLISPEVSEVLTSFILGNIAKCWSDLGEYEKSINYKLQLLENNINHIEVLLGTNNNLGSNYYELKQYDLAEKYLQITLDLMDQHQVFTNQGIPLLRMGLIQYEKGILSRANFYADRIDYWLIKYQFVGNYKILFYQFKSKIAKANTDFEQAIYWLEKAAIEQDSINKITSLNNFIRLEGQNKYAEIAKERTSLENERDLIQRQKIILTIALFIALLSIYLSTLAYKKKSKNQLNPTLSSDQLKNTAPNKPNAKKINGSRGPTPIIEIDTILKQKILTALSEDRLFLSQDLTLKNFSDRLDSNTSYVSKTINDGFGKNFNALINEYRIEEVLRLFQEGQHQTFTIESIYQKAGFKSKSSFQKAFKAKTGVTATHYLNHIS